MLLGQVLRQRAYNLGFSKGKQQGGGNVVGVRRVKGGDNAVTLVSVCHQTTSSSALPKAPSEKVLLKVGSEGGKLVCIACGFVWGAGGECS